MKIKLRDLTEEQYKEWKEQNCCEKISCEECIFNFVNCICGYQKCWIKNKDLFNDKFLDQEVEIEIKNKPILTDKEKEYLSAVIKPFRDRIMWIMKHDFLSTNNQFIVIQMTNDTFLLPLFEENKYYKNMEVDKEYTLEELGL